MTDRRQRQPASDETPHAIPKDTAVLTAPRQRVIPEPPHLEPKNVQRILVHGYTVVPVVSTHHRFEPLAQFGDGFVPAPAYALEKGPPRKELVTAMRKFNEDMTKAGVLLAAEGLHLTSKGTRLRVSRGERVVTDGPFTEAKEVIAGLWMIQVKSNEEAIEWAKRCPLPEGGLIEIRQVFENCDFPPELQKRTPEP